jgi:hypothetical protein
MMCPTVLPASQSRPIRRRTVSEEMLNAIRRVAEREFAAVPLKRREVLVQRAIKESLLVLAKLDAAGARELAYPLPLARAGIARMGRSLA